MRILPASLLTSCLLSLAVAAAEPAKPAGSNPAAAKPPAPAAKAQAIVGVVYNSAGKPIKEGVVVTVAGRTTLGGARAEYTVTPGEDGRYESDLPDGVYKVWATVDVEYNGRQFRLPLASEDKKDAHAAYNSAKGIVKSFVWQLSGLKPNARPREYGSHWGVGVLLFDAAPRFEPETHLKSKYPGSTVVVRLEPVGPLVDGSEGKPLDLETPSEALDIRSPKCKHLDVPLGDYKATAKLRLKDGGERPLMIEVGPRAEVSKPGIKASREVKLEFEQGENGGIPAFNLSLGE